MKKSLMAFAFVFIFVSCSSPAVKLVFTSAENSDEVSFTKSEWQEFERNGRTTINALDGSGNLEILHGKRVIGWLKFDQPPENPSVLLISSGETQKVKVVKKLGDDGYNLIPYSIISSITNGFAFTFPFPRINTQKSR